MSQVAEDRSDRNIQELERHVARQKAFVRGMIVGGAPTQACEDRLRQLQQKLSRMKERARIPKP